MHYCSDAWPHGIRAARTGEETSFQRRPPHLQRCNQHFSYSLALSPGQDKSAKQFRLKPSSSHAQAQASLDGADLATPENLAGCTFAMMHGRGCKRACHGMWSGKGTQRRIHIEAQGEQYLYGTSRCQHESVGGNRQSLGASRCRGGLRFFEQPERE